MRKGNLKTILPLMTFAMMEYEKGNNIFEREETEWIIGKLDKKDKKTGKREKRRNRRRNESRN